ncbi:protein GRAVITROPIC IN THE LIGHT 1-like [Cicer arietinum]|nr:protein GRAVITROPIC IN THE LIGHT 1-like isoform X2 [Cicer arietinum]XP_012575447.1 protein GRAVITROPIC IN THE LIGHT 1-like isoform X2 [Cicer arietinum]XP_027186381.1 protein GRAVITROPIC IN THE LIGHT 1-like isoform X2 [Cicer arietinum]
MESVKPSAVTPRKSKLARTFSKVLHVKSMTGVAPKNVRVDDHEVNMTNKEDEEVKKKLVTEALVSKVFASISTVKASYAHLQYAQSPYDPDGIQAADKLLVSELKTLSELKQCWFKKQFDFDPSLEGAIVVAESKELKSVTKTYKIMAKKLESQARLRDSEIMFLKEKLEEAIKQNKSIEKKLNQSPTHFISLSSLDNLHISGLSPTHFIYVLRHTVRSIRSFVKLLVNEMRSSNWDIDASVNAIVEENVVYWKEDHKCFAIESFVCREMFDSFNFPNFNLSNESIPDRNKTQFFFGRFNELKSMKAREFLALKPSSTSFAKFCRVKYLRLVHPKMEASFFGEMKHRNILNAGEFPLGNNFFTSFAEMAKRIWLLHCLAFSFEPHVEIFQVGKTCRFSDVYMESVVNLNDEVVEAVESEPQVGFTVIPGFKIGKTVLQCQVYLSQKQAEGKNVNSMKQR